MDLKDKQVVVTGASSGIGMELSRLAASRGARVVLIARRAEKLEAVAAECRAKGGQARIVQADLSLEADCRRAMAESGAMDLLILNAGISHRGPVTELADWKVFGDMM